MITVNKVGVMLGMVHESQSEKARSKPPRGKTYALVYVEVHIPEGLGVPIEDAEVGYAK